MVAVGRHTQRRGVHPSRWLSLLYQLCCSPSCPKYVETMTLRTVVLPPATLRVLGSSSRSARDTTEGPLHARTVDQAQAESVPFHLSRHLRAFSILSAFPFESTMTRSTPLLLCLGIAACTPDEPKPDAEVRAEGTLRGAGAQIQRRDGERGARPLRPRTAA